jgi:hypothetical protein
VGGSGSRGPVDGDVGVLDAVFDDVRHVHAEMWDIRLRHAEHAVSAHERVRYLTCWRALALRRSPGRRPFLPPEFDDVLAERAELLEDIRDERTRRDVDAIFEGAPEDEAPAPGSSIPR